MSRNVRAAATALALAGGVYFVGAMPAAASNMGFKLERSFDLVRRTAAPNNPLPNIYWMSRPLFDGIGDVANSDPTGPVNKCVGDVPGATVGDGILNSDDVICDMWLARTNIPTAGTFTMSYIKREECIPVSRIGTTALGAIRFNGTSFALQPDIGYQVLITVPTGATYSPQNRAVIVGSHDPSFAGRTITAAPTCAAGQTTNCCGASAPRRDLINLPYHTMYTNSDEILCGLEGVDWTDVGGRPDKCWDDTNADGIRQPTEATTGVFDGLVAMSVSKFANDETIGAPVSRNVTYQLGLRFTGTRYDLVPGDAYLLNISKLHTPTTWISPHY